MQKTSLKKHFWQKQQQQKAEAAALSLIQQNSIVLKTANNGLKFITTAIKKKNEDPIRILMVGIQGIFTS